MKRLAMNFGLASPRSSSFCSYWRRPPCHAPLRRALVVDGARLLDRLALHSEPRILHFKENDHAITGRINSLGWRDFERARGKPEGAYRIVAMGDSYVEAFQVELESTFVAIAERSSMTDSSVRGGDEPRPIGDDAGRGADRLRARRPRPRTGPDRPPVRPAERHRRRQSADADELTRPFVRVSATGELQFDSSFVESSRFRTQRRIKAFKQHSALMSLLASATTPGDFQGAARRGAGDEGAAVNLAERFLSARNLRIRST